MTKPRHIARPNPAMRVRIEGKGKQEIEISRHRLIVTAGLFVLCFFALGGRLIDLAFLQNAPDRGPAIAAADAPQPVRRADIVDRNGMLIATNLSTASVYAHPGQVLDPFDAATKLVSALPELDWDRVVKRLTSEASFVWISRRLTPREQVAVNALGIPGVHFLEEDERVYPHGALLAHVLGFVDIDNHGLAGIERYFDDKLTRLNPGRQPMRTSLDIRVQHALRDELAQAMAAHGATGAAGVVMDARTGEVLALVSLPDFDPDDRASLDERTRFNRASMGVYEMGSIFKTFNVALALDRGVVGLSDGYDATEPLRVARYVIKDDHAQERWLSVPEIYIHSSNIGSAKMALEVGTDRQRRFLDELGLLNRAAVELPEAGSPLYPQRWRDINTMTISFGHGIAVSPLQTAAGIAAMINGGHMRQPTLLPVDGAPPEGTRVISERTSRTMRALMRLVVEDGTGSKADAAGYFVGGKTGTAEKAGVGGYDEKALISSFVGAFPMDDPRYVVFAMLDEPKGTRATFNFAGGGWTAAPVVRRTITRIAPILGIAPRDHTDQDNPLTLASMNR